MAEFFALSEAGQDRLWREMHRYQTHRPVLERRLRAMVGQLQAPYHLATLPQVMTPDDVQSEQSA